MPIDKILINATQPEEVRVAFVESQRPEGKTTEAESHHRLVDLDIDSLLDDKKKGNVYSAIVTRVEPSLNAVFIEYSAKRQGFLPFKEISPEYYAKPVESMGENPPLTALIRVGQALLVQVEKEERGNKGAALTSFITLAGCYLVLMPNNPTSGGISRRIEGDDRDELRETLNALELPEGMGVIIRTAGVGKNKEELQADLDMLCNQWQAIRHAFSTQPSPCLIHQEGDVVIRAIRDNLRKHISEIIIDSHACFVKAKQYISQVKPEFLPHLKLYNNTIPLFNSFQIESQIEIAYQREVILPSGGALVIDRTEALVSIDVNSAKATSGSDIETTALNTNLEAAEEIARQLRLRDLGGLVVIDFIDMSARKNQKEVEHRLKEALKADRARIQVGPISRFGLLEMSRQRLRLSLGEAAQELCPRCEGRGMVRNIQSQSFSIIRLIEEEALKEKTAEVQVQLPVELATFIINEKRDAILQIEKRHETRILLIANPYMQVPHYTITRIREDNVGKMKKPSYSLIQKPDIKPLDTQPMAKLEEPAVKPFLTSKMPCHTQVGILKRIWKSLFQQLIVPASAPLPTPPPVQEKLPAKTTREYSDKRPGNNPANKQRKRYSGNTQQNAPKHTQNANNNPKRPRPSPQNVPRTSGNKNEPVKKKENIGNSLEEK